jgi:hypothetical protein
VPELGEAVSNVVPGFLTRPERTIVKQVMMADLVSMWALAGVWLVMGFGRVLRVVVA